MHPTPYPCTPCNAPSLAAIDLTRNGEGSAEAAGSESEGAPLRSPTPGSPEASNAHEIQPGSGGGPSEPENRARALPGTGGDLSGPEDGALSPLPGDTHVEGSSLVAVKPEPSSASGSSALVQYWELGKMAFDEDELARYDLHCHV